MGLERQNLRGKAVRQMSLRVGEEFYLRLERFMLDKRFPYMSILVMDLVNKALDAEAGGEYITYSNQFDFDVRKQLI